MKIRRPALIKFFNQMKKMSIEVNDIEICKKLETLIMTSKQDLSMNLVNSLLENSPEFNVKDVEEPFVQYVRHYLYMIKRNKKLGHFYKEDHQPTVEKNKKTIKKSTK